MNRLNRSILLFPTKNVLSMLLVINLLDTVVDSGNGLCSENNLRGGLPQTSSNVYFILLGGRRAYMQVVPTHKMEVAFLLHSFRRSSVVVRHWNSVLLVSCGQQRQLHTEGLLNEN